MMKLKDKMKQENKDFIIKYDKIHNLSGNVSYFSVKNYYNIS